jgi:hypothetical protein
MAAQKKNPATGDAGTFPHKGTKITRRPQREKKKREKPYPVQLNWSPLRPLCDLCAFVLNSSF